MPWYNPLSTESGNGKTGPELDAERAAMDRERAVRKENEARDLEDAGYLDDADASRVASAAWQVARNENLQRQAATDAATPWDAFQDELGVQADQRRKTFTDIITTSVGTIFKLIPWPVWLAAGVWLAWQLGWFTALFKKARA